MGLPGACDIPPRANDLTIRLASEADLDALVRLAAAFRNHLGLSTPADADLGASLTHLLQDTATEFFLACKACGMPLGYVQARYRYSVWTTAWEAELEDVFVIRSRGAFGCAETNRHDVKEWKSPTVKDEPPTRAPSHARASVTGSVKR